MTISGGDKGNQYPREPQNSDATGYLCIQSVFFISTSTLKNIFTTMYLKNKPFSSFYYFSFKPTCKMSD